MPLQYSPHLAAIFLLSGCGENGQSRVETMPFITAALEKFNEQPPAVSLTDCIVMAVADAYKTKEVFGFDKQFEDAGYHRLTPSTEWK
jgi:predicted nucleic acid-binding protein